MRWLVGLVLLAASLSCSSGQSVVVGSKNFTEQVILGEMLAQLLESRGTPVDRRLNLGGTFICHQALVAGDLDLYVEYSGTALTAILKEPVSHDPDLVYRRAREVYRSELGIEWSAPLGFNNTFAIVVRPELAERLGLRTIADLRAHGGEMRLGSGHEFLEREDGYSGLVEAYQLSFTAAPRGLELGLVYRALMEGEVDFVAGNSTDGLIEKFGLVVLEDDRRYFPPYAAAIVYRPETAERHPAVHKVIRQLEGSLDEAAMRRLNRLVDDEKQSVAKVVANFLAERGMVDRR